MVDPQCITASMTMVLFIFLFLNIPVMQRIAAPAQRIHDTFIPVAELAVNEKGGSHV